MKIPGRVFVAAIAAAALPLTFTPPASAETYLYMKPAQLEQAVLRAQPGVSLGQWTQNFYYTNERGESASALRPLVCPTATKKNVTLPKADSFGAVGYEVSQDISMSVTIWQYKSEAEAQSAKDAFMNANCPDNPRIAWEDGKYYLMDAGGGDYTTSEIKGVPAYVKGYEGTVADTPISVAWAVRPVGKAVVRIEVDLYGNAAKSSANQTKAIKLAENWVDAASKAVLKFSSNDPNAA